MNRFLFNLSRCLALVPIMLMATPAFAGIETMMANLQSAVLNILAPAVCVFGLCFSGFRLVMGDESAKGMMMWSCIGTVLSFSAPTILSFLQNRVAS